MTDLPTFGAERVFFNPRSTKLTADTEVADVTTQYNYALLIRDLLIGYLLYALFCLCRFE